jgi:dienelactone hydrolase
MSEQTEREAMLREVAKKRVVYVAPGMEALPVRRDLTFRSTSGTEILMDVYYPSLSPDKPLPLVLLPLAYPDPTARVRAYGPLTSWAQLMAASGMAAVVYGTEAPEEDVHALLRHLRAEAATLALDVDRFGLFAASGSVTVGLSTLMRDGCLRCGALLYGYTMDMDGAATVADMSRQFGFVNACAGKSVDDLPDHVPILFVRAGRDQFPGLNAALDRVIERAVARNLPLSFINHAAGAHGFDVDEQTATSRGIVQQVLAFLRLHLTM